MDSWWSLMFRTCIGTQQAEGEEGRHKLFERQAEVVKYHALLVAILQKFSRVLGIMALTWATAVLLGGLIGSLIPFDFYLISILLLLQSVRLFVTEMFAKMISRILFREHRDPIDFQFIDRQPYLETRLSRVGSFISALLAFLCLVATIVRLCLNSSHSFYPEKNDNNNDIKNVIQSILIFYSLVLFNSAIAILSSFLHEVGLWRIRRITIGCDNCDQDDNSLATFYNSIYKTAIDDSITKAEDLQVLEFGFDKIAGELKRNIRHQRVRTLNSRILKFMYADEGVAMACVHMNGEDLWKLTAAAHLPGFWTQEKKIETQQDLFRRLCKRMHGAGNDAIGAFNSVTSLARYWSEPLENTVTASEQRQNGIATPSEQCRRLSGPHPFLHKSTFKEGNIVDTIVDLVLTPFRPKMLFRVRALEACCRDPQVRNYLYEKTSSSLGEEITNTEISTRIQEYLFDTSNNMQRASKIDSTLLAKLCMKLAVMVKSGEKVRTVSKIYSAKALLSLVRHPHIILNEATMNWLKELIQDKITLPRQGDKITLTRQDTAYFVKDDIVAAEEVRFALGLPPLEDWPSVTVRKPACDGGPVIDPHEIRTFVEHIRNRLTEKTPNNGDVELDLATYDSIISIYC